jgi:hypothetical protein
MSSLDRLAVRTAEAPAASSSEESGSDPASSSSAGAEAKTMDMTELSSAMRAMMRQMQDMQARISQPPPPTPVTTQPSEEAIAAAVAKLAGMRGPGRTAGKTPKPLGDGSLMDQLRSSVAHTRGAAKRQTMFDDDDHDEDSDVSSISSRHTRRQGSRGHRRSDDDSLSRSDAAAADGFIAKRLLERIFKYHRSAYAYVMSLEFHNPRNMHEARRTAQIIDSFLGEGVTTEYEGMEMLVRNLAGLCKSDELRDASIMEEFEWAPPEDIVPRDIFRAVAKNAQRKKKLVGGKAPTGKKQ